MLELLKKHIDLYKADKAREKQKKRLLNKELDYSFLQYLIDTTDQNRQIRVILKDGTVLLIEKAPDKRVDYNSLIEGELIIK